MPQLYVGFGFTVVGIHCRFHLVRVKDEHLAFSSTASNNSTFLFDEASSIVEPNLHTLFHDPVNLDEILCYGWNMQDILDVDLITFFTERDVSDMLNGVNCVIPNFNIAWLFWFSQVWKPFLVRCHMFRGT